MGDFSLWLIIVTVIVFVMVVLVNIYVLINYQHPDDANQAWFPKIVVVAGLSISMIAVLMLPLDVANRKACSNDLVSGACSLTLPMKELWYAVWMIDAIFVFFVIPFSIFYYEGDQEKSIGQRIVSALLWCFVIALVVGLVLGIAYGLGGYVDYPVQRLVTSTAPISTTSINQLSDTQPCFDGGKPSSVVWCDAIQSAALSQSVAIGETWTLRPSFPVYVIALVTIVGSCFFSIFGAVGLMSLPLDMVFAFLRRPTKVITRAEYIKEATELGKRARDIKDVAQALQREERSGNKGRGWRNSVRKLQRELVLLEEDEHSLEEVYPQGEQADTLWAMTILRYLGNLVFGIIGFVVSVLWLIHIVLYVLIKPPVTLFLNQLFIKLDSAFGLFGTAAFAAFCFYLFLCLIAGEMKLGMNVVVFTIHPMKPGGTLMNSFLFNVGLIMLCCPSVIYFCAVSFSAYAQETAVNEIFGHQLRYLRGIRYLFKFNVFQYVLVIVAICTLMWYLAFGWKKKAPRRRIMVSDLKN